MLISLKIIAPGPINDLTILILEQFLITMLLHIFKHVFNFVMNQMLQIYWTQLHQRTGKEAIPYFSTVRNANAGHVRL